MQSIKNGIKLLMAGMNNNVKKLITKGLACHLPVSVAAHNAFPLVLSTLDSKLSSTRLQLRARERRLHFYQEIMRVLQLKYEATDRVYSFIANIVSSSKLKMELNPASMIEDPSYDDDTPNHGLSPILRHDQRPLPVHRIKNVCEYFVRRPHAYVRLSLLLDLALCRGQYPCEDEIGSLWRRLRVTNSIHLPSAPISNLSWGGAYRSFESPHVQFVSPQKVISKDPCLEEDETSNGHSDSPTICPSKLELPPSGHNSREGTVVSDHTQVYSDGLSGWTSTVADIWNNIPV